MERYIPFSQQLRNCTYMGICKIVIDKNSPANNHCWCVKYKTKCTSHVCYEERTGEKLNRVDYLEEVLPQNEMDGG